MKKGILVILAIVALATNAHAATFVSAYIDLAAITFKGDIDIVGESRELLTMDGIPNVTPVDPEGSVDYAGMILTSNIDQTVIMNYSFELINHGEADEDLLYSAVYLNLQELQEPYGYYAEAYEQWTYGVIHEEWAEAYELSFDMKAGEQLLAEIQAFAYIQDVQFREYLTAPDSIFESAPKIDQAFLTPSPVPEPLSLSMLGIGLLGVFKKRRK